MKAIRLTVPRQKYTLPRKDFHAFERRLHDVCIRPCEDGPFVEISREISQPVAIKEPRDYHLRANFLAEDMGLPSMFVPGTSKQINMGLSH